MSKMINKQKRGLGLMGALLDNYWRSLPILLHLLILIPQDTLCRTGLELDMDYPQSSWVQGENIEVEQGKNLTLTCRVPAVQFFDVLRVKLIQGNKTLTISDNGDVKAPFALLPRYHVLYVYVPDIATVTIAYNGILGEDSGILTCQKLSSTTALLNLKVLAPLTSLRMYRLSDVTSGNMTVEQVEDGGVVELEQNRISGIRCIAIVVSSVDVPMVDMTVGTQKLNLQPYQQVAVLPPSPASSSSTPVMQELTRHESSADLTYTTDKPSARYHGKTLTCTATTNDIFEHLRVSVTLFVKFIPILTCSLTSYEARHGDNVTMKCILESNPESIVKWTSANKEKLLQTDKYFSFQFQPLEVNTDKSSPSSSSSLSSSSSHSSSSSSSLLSTTSSSMVTVRKQVVMTITKVKESHFGSYAVTATNHLGTTSVAMTLSKMSVSHVVPPSNKPAEKPHKQQQNSRTQQRQKNYPRANRASCLEMSVSYLLISVATGLRLRQPRR